MRIKNRLSPYPILNNFGDDYVGSSFTVEYKMEKRFKEIFWKLTFKLDNSEIQRLIEDKRACYVVHVESPSTCYRHVFISDETELELKINSSLLSNVIEMRTFIILTQSVKAFWSPKFHPDYQEQAFDLEPNQIIAVGTAMDYKVEKDDRDFESLPSVLKIVKLQSAKKGTLSVNTDTDAHVVIGLAEETFELYAQLGRNTFKETAFSLVLFPALMVVLQRMYNGRDDEAINSMHWYKVIEELLNKNNISIENLSIDNDSLLTICQSIFADPISRSFKELATWSERM